ncbi:GDSL-type esterase/lipase family protein [Cohnella sp. REN36]|uniref:GDSL-type esterase/lipase family protein n=1 Tax=Cohnella sp. REN36 TaxID=2887347 RepID=UPI001D133188|nr:GDSL-type esterase/lipase family protein [Cohnella sp. REN36]MCC3373304.1 GDSL-type esterase/lipase family protein [Cohnella sp. REN36]
MKSKKSWLWPSLGFVSLGCTLLLLFGFGWALKDAWAPSAGIALPGGTPQPVATGGAWEDKHELLVTAIGDSLTRGTGDASGQGYVRGTVDRLQKALGKPVKLVNNLGINGLEASNLTIRLDDEGFKGAIAQADLLLVTIGGNDLFHVAQNGGSLAEGGDIDVQLLQTRLIGLKPRLETVFRKLRALNPNGRIVYVGLYNPFYDVPALRESVGAVIDEWNGYARRLAETDGNAAVVPTYDLFETDVTRYLSSDHFHPNADGYARIAERVAQTLE